MEVWVSGSEACLQAKRSSEIVLGPTIINLLTGILMIKISALQGQKYRLWDTHHSGL